MTNRATIKLADNYKRNLADLEQLLIEAESSQAFHLIVKRIIQRNSLWVKMKFLILEISDSSHRL